ncbi:hypothetical protein [Bacillus andreraoultii]|uniref:hypothetical protein n=1 Tax=Bacillus andreraoultii TaxID=1499685 RepID=UPI00053A61D2|nr:hypothetical protein [Bacillus andreraoultii]
MDHYAKKLLSGKAILIFVEAFLHQRLSLWNAQENLRANDELQKLIGLEDIHESTIYRKLEKLPIGLLQELSVSLFGWIDAHHRGVQNVMDIGPLAVVDSSEITLPQKAGEWAYASRDKNIHLRLAVLNEDTSYPQGIIASTTAVSDQEVAVALVVDKDATYVFDCSRRSNNYHILDVFCKSSAPFCGISLYELYFFRKNNSFI